MKLADGYRQLTTCEVGNGTSVLFWSDNWKQHSLEETYPHLFSFAKDKLCSLKQALSITEVSQAFHTPLSSEAMVELRNLQTDLHGMTLNSETNDRWMISYTKNGACIPKAIYKLFFSHMMNHFPSQWIWKSKCMSKHKFFAWLVLHDRINTKDMLLRRHWNVSEDNNCVLCPCQVLEDWSHLFFECNFSSRIWSYLQVSWGSGSSPEMLQRAKNFSMAPVLWKL